MPKDSLDLARYGAHYAPITSDSSGYVTTWKMSCSCGEWEYRTYQYDGDGTQNDYTRLCRQARREHFLQTRGEKRMKRQDIINARIRELEREAARLSAMPAEPETIDPDEALVVWWRKTFHGGAAYTYTAVKVNDRWWVTGSRGNNIARTWDELLEFVAQGSSEPVQIWTVSEWVDAGTVPV
jgi:hypothetical protein